MKAFKIIFIALLFSFPFISSASHMMGAEITYKWISNKKYEVTVKIYRDCRGIPLSSPTISVSDYNGTTMALSYNRTSIEDITVRCSDTISKPCNPLNTTVGSEGIELHTFVAIADFGASPFNSFVINGACKVYFSAEQCCRNGAITTLNTGNFYIDAMLDLCKSNFRNTSPQFKSHNVMSAQCNVPFSQNFGSKDFVDYDSLAYELVNPLNAAKSNESYQGSFSSNIPMTPFCVTTGQISCSPSPNSKPPRGFYFNKQSGDIVFTPVNCAEVGVIAVKISEYRRDSTNTKWLLVGYVIRDIQIAIKSISGNNTAPTSDLASTYNFRTREKQCIDIKSYDTLAAGYSSSNKGDVTSMSISELPEGATFIYTDSTARNKTGRLCWTIHDSVYLKFKNKNKLLSLTLELRDNFCSIPNIIQKSFSIKILPPDSSGYLSVGTFLDPNKNTKKDTGEQWFPALLKFKDKNSAYYVDTDEKGAFGDSIGVGKLTIGLASHPYLSASGKDTTITVKMDSVYHLNFGAYQTPGIFGRIYHDANNNCKFDKGELVYSGYKVYTDSNKYVGISDKNGLYLIKAPKGSYTLTCDYKPHQFAVNCPSSQKISISINGDSTYQGNDFGISQNMKYTDLQAGLNIDRMRRGNLSSVNFYCTNLGPKVRKNITLYSPVNSKFDLTLNSSLFAAAGSTAAIKIDSILPGKTFSIKLDFFVSSTGFKSGDKVCFAVTTDTASIIMDSIKDNNYYLDCRNVDAPYDPNEKRVAIDSAKTTLDKTIDYTIHFQNSGTDTANRIIVTDTIDTRYLDMAGFRMNWSDAPVETIISGNIIHFIFNDIRLPFLSKSGALSMAGFNFTLGLKSDVKQETSFANKAAIYFDFEDPIFTPDAIATINSPIAITKLKKTSLCKNEFNTLYYKSNIAFSPGNELVLELSDINGLFGNPTTLKTISSTALADSISFGLPSSLSSGKYKLRMRSTGPKTIGIAQSGVADLTLLPTPANALKALSTNLNNNAGCDKDTLKLSFNYVGYHYKITRNNNLLNNYSTQRNYQYLLNYGDSFKLLALDPTSGCTDTASLIPLIFGKPVINAQILQRKKEYCDGEKISIAASGGKYYKFYQNNIALSPTSDSVYLIGLNKAAYFQVKGTDMNGCSNFSDTLQVTVKPAPFATLSSFPDPVCFGDSATLIFGVAPLYDLYKNNQKILDKTGTNSYKIKDLKDGDIYKINAIGTNGCSTESKELIIKINPVPAQPVILQSLNDLSVSFTGIVKWYRNGVLTNHTSNTYSNAPGGIYTVVVTNAEGCSNTSNTFVHRNSGIGNLEAPVFKIYPNPASQELTIENSTSGGPFSVAIYDLNGQILYSSDDNNGAETIDLRIFSSGLYLLRINDEKGNLINRMISINK